MYCYSYCVVVATVYGSLVSSSADTIDKSDETWRPHGTAS